MANNTAVHDGEGCGTACILSMVDNASVESRRYYLARRTLMEMLRDRGYVVANMEVELRRSLADFHEVFGDKPEAERLRIIACRASDPSRKGDLNPAKQDECSCSKGLDEYPVKVETFPITGLLFNITKHFLATKHEILTPEDKETLLKKHSIEDKQLPRMLENDAIAKYYGLEKGQVVKVTHSSGVAGLVVTYRCVM
ncbi:DNA-directed RNA polymerase V subunitC [Sesamum angolense]|uniref:DNA-directed RNA polymerase V subunitC n=1 Tax=Sesamum angolense TaxID=2727404 RepID=A0AAE2C6R6_9LAMI|nr:DNA-directed RNA polymerase V subunitC [Sesamum angolense]